MIKPKTSRAALEAMMERIYDAAEEGQLSFRGGTEAEQWIITVKAVRNAMADALALHEALDLIGEQAKEIERLSRHG